MFSHQTDPHLGRYCGLIWDSGFVTLLLEYYKDSDVKTSKKGKEKKFEQRVLTFVPPF